MRSTSIRCTPTVRRHGATLDAGEKEKIEAAIKDVEEALKGDNKDAIESKTQAMMTASQKLGEKMYASMQGDQAAGAAAGAGQQAGAEADKSKESDVVDADYKEVKRG